MATKDPLIWKNLYATYGEMRNDYNINWGSGTHHLFLPSLAKEVLVPMFEYYDVHSDFGVIIPQWYLNYKQNGRD